MSKIIAKISLICWGFFTGFVVVLTIAMAIPENLLAIVSLVLGLCISIPIGVNIFRVYKSDGFDFGWFLVVSKGYWRILLLFVGLFLTIAGGFSILLPAISAAFWEKYAMIFVKVLTVLFWLSLVSTFLGWQVICLAESIIYLRIKKFKYSLTSFALGILWLFFVLLFSTLFLGLIDDVFFQISNANQTLILICFAILTILGGLAPGFRADTKYLEEEDEFFAD